MSKLDTLKAELEELTAQQRELKKREKTVKDAIVFYESNPETTENLIRCPKCGKDYKEPNAPAGHFPDDVVRYVIVSKKFCGDLYKDKVVNIAFGRACPECVEKIWVESLETMVQLGYMVKEGDEYTVKPEYR